MNSSVELLSCSRGSGKAVGVQQEGGVSQLPHLALYGVPGVGPGGGGGGGGKTRWGRGARALEGEEETGGRGVKVVVVGPMDGGNKVGKARWGVGCILKEYG